MGIVVAWDIIIDDLGFAGSKLSIATKFSQNCVTLLFGGLIVRARCR
jgi:hypothetical protein